MSDGFHSRSERSTFILNRYRAPLSSIQSLLDVGCSAADLASNLPAEVAYTGIEANPRMLALAQQLAQKRPRTRILDMNLETQPLPFPDNTFDWVVCTEVLEHLDQFHFVFNELLRVSRRHVLISLPNMYWLPLRLEILFGRGSKGGNLESPMKFYGLPPTVPGDRHRWFFSYEQIQDFMRHQTSCRIAEEFGYFGVGNGSFRSRLKDWFIRKRGLWPNLFAMSYWCLLEKIPVGPLHETASQKSAAISSSTR